MAEVQRYGSKFDFTILQSRLGSFAELARVVLTVKAVQRGNRCILCQAVVPFVTYALKLFQGHAFRRQKMKDRCMDRFTECVECKNSHAIRVASID